MSSREYRRNAMKLSKVRTIICHCVQKLIPFAEGNGLSYAEPDPAKICTGYNFMNPCPWKIEITEEKSSLSEYRGVLHLSLLCSSV
jgi:hypothetical protein